MKREHIEVEGLKLLGNLTQQVRQYDNQELSIYANEKGLRYLVEDTGCDRRIYEYATDEDEDVNKLLYAAAENCAESVDYAYGKIMESIAWGLKAPEDYVVKDDYEGNVSILSVGNYLGYSPIEIVIEDEFGTQLIFENYDVAKGYIEEMEARAYHLSHGENGRPKYYIVEAQ